MYRIDIAPGLPLQAYLDAEQALAAHFAEMTNKQQQAGLFMVWQSPPTVIYGRNQVAEQEVNLDFCRKRGIAVVQRKSGGGCVYSDPGNVMVSMIVRPGPVEEVFPRQMERIAGFLRSLGLAAEVSGRNDILVDGRKVSGNAYCKTPTADIVHGTLLFDVDFDILERAITPSAEKLGRHGVASVRSRVDNLRPLLAAAGRPLDLHGFLERLTFWLEDSGAK